MSRDLTVRNVKKNQQYLIVAELVNQGKKIDEIAKETKFSKSKVRKILSDNLFKAILATQYKNAMSLSGKRLANLFEKSLEQLDEIMGCGDPELMLKAIAEVRKTIKLHKEMEFDDGDSQPLEYVQTQTITKRPDGEVLSIQDQKKIVHKLRSKNAD